MTAYLAAIGLFLSYVLFEIWRSGIVVDGQESIRLFGDFISFGASSEVRLILLVMVVGALGGYIHTANSFVAFVGNRQIYTSWVWGYILRPFIGVALALIFYFLIRGGLFSAGAGAESISPFGIAAMAGLVGMFSQKATDKLREVADSLFNIEKKSELSEPLVKTGPAGESGGTEEPGQPT